MPGYTYEVGDFGGGTTPKADREDFSGLPDSSGDVHPKADREAFSGLPDSSGDTEPKPPICT